MTPIHCTGWGQKPATTWSASRTSRNGEYREPDWHGRTARSQYRESDLYQPLGSILFGRLGGFRARAALIVAIIVVYNATLGWLAWDAWTNGPTTSDRVLVAATVAIGAAAGWIVADVERAYRRRSRMYG